MARDISSPPRWTSNPATLPIILASPSPPPLNDTASNPRDETNLLLIGGRVTVSTSWSSSGRWCTRVRPCFRLFWPPRGVGAGQHAQGQRMTRPGHPWVAPQGLERGARSTRPSVLRPEGSLEGEHRSPKVQINGASVRETGWVAA